MLEANNIGLQFGKRKLFDKVNITFTQGNCYGLIGANGSGKSTFLKILSGEIDSTAGSVNVVPGKRISVLKQDQFAFDQYTVLNTVIMGHQKLYDCIMAKDALYAKPDFSEKDGVEASHLEEDFAEMDGWNADSDAAKLLSDLGIKESLHTSLMKNLEGSEKIRVLLAQALFGNPDILLLDEPTNQLDMETCMWMEDFLIDFDNTTIIVSHDRHFLDKVCTHIADIDYGKIKVYPGNYSYWSESSQLAMRQRSDANKKTAEKRKELEAFIARFSANASKSRQATSRKKILEKLTIETIQPSSRKYPYLGFTAEREAGNDILRIDHLSHAVDGVPLFKDLNLTVEKGDKIAFLGRHDLAKTALFQILEGKIKANHGTFKWGASTSRSFYSKDNSEYFNNELPIINWLSQYTKSDDEQFIRGFLGRVLFSGDEQNKSVNVLSGGERVRCMMARMMLTGSNILILDEPTNHLDMESISALDNGMKSFNGTILFSSHDHALVQSVANRIIEIAPGGNIDKHDTTLDEYFSDEVITSRREALYAQMMSDSGK